MEKNFDLKKLEDQHRIEIENTRAQMRKGILEFCILLIISEGKIYANDILGRLKQAELVVVEGTIYPLLNRLKRSELLSHAWEESKSGPPRKYYSLTSKGEETLKYLSLTWDKFNKSINSIIKDTALYSEKIKKGATRGKPLDIKKSINK